jgi:hypothetical protein
MSNAILRMPTERVGVVGASNIVVQALLTVLNSLYNVLNPPSNVLNSLYNVLNPLNNILNSLYNVLNPLSNALNSLSNVLNPPSNILNSLYNVLNPLSNVLNLLYNILNAFHSDPEQCKNRIVQHFAWLSSYWDGHLPRTTDYSAAYAYQFSVQH